MARRVLCWPTTLNRRCCRSRRRSHHRKRALGSGAFTNAAAALRVLTADSPTPASARLTQEAGQRRRRPRRFELRGDVDVAAQ